MLFANPQVLRQPYPATLMPLLSRAQAQHSRALLAPWADLHPGPTPLWSLPGLAQRLGLSQLWVKDESRRSVLGSFKVLGAPVALLRWLLRRHPDAGWTAQSLWLGQHAAALAGCVVITATDGNHGRALAAAARRVGCRCVIVVHAQVSEERVAAMVALGAEVRRIAGNYDASVREAQRLAEQHGWQVVSDTSYEGYEDIPRDVMQGYSVIALEAMDQAVGLEPDEPPFTHVLLQGGVGGLAAGVLAPLWERWGAQRPITVVVEPAQANCLIESARQGRPSGATGSVDSIMAGLACGEPSPLAWQLLAPGVDFFMTVDDTQAVDALRDLARAPAGDVPVQSGESGAAGLAGLQALMARPDWARQLGLGPQSRVLLINTEGATAPGLYTQLLGHSPAQVLAAQAHWLAGRGLSQDRLMARLHSHGRIGALLSPEEQASEPPAHGVCRIALTDADRAGRDQLVAWMSGLGLRVEVDAIGNIFGIRAGQEAGAPVMTGSHIDTVATGGRYDGIYGVMAGLEVVQWLNERGLSTRHPLVVAAFTNEEGVRYAPDMMGSLVFAGGLPLAQALDTQGTDGTRLGDELARIGYAGEGLCPHLRPRAFVELHIEQGPVLEAEGYDLGVVDRLQGISWQAITFTGQSNHAGTTPMHLRRDAGHAAAAVAVFVRELVTRLGADHPGMVGTVGSLRLHPNLINVIAARADLTVDLRHTDDAVLRQAEAELAAYLQAVAQAQGLRVSTQQLARFEPVVFDDALAQRIATAASAQGLRHRRMSSGAGHDAQMIARIDPAAMIFVPSQGGLSHNPREFTPPQQLHAGAEVLREVLCGLAEVMV